jgi:hypothetical protein
MKSGRRSISSKRRGKYAGVRRERPLAKSSNVFILIVYGKIRSFPRSRTLA